MSKIICDVCGTSYPETATQCPICGCVRPAEAKTVAGDTNEAGAQPSGTYTYVKGGRFSKANVKKRNRANQNPAAAPAVKAEEPVQKDGKKDVGLTVTVLVLLLAIVAVVIYIALRFFMPGVTLDNNDADTTTTASTTQQLNTTEDTVLEIPCTSLVISKTTVEFDTAGAALLLNVSKDPVDTTDTVVFASSDETVATVTEDGKIVAVGGGEAVITVTCGEASAQCMVVCNIVEETTESTETVTYPTDDFKLRKEDFTLSTKGESYKLYSGVIPVEEIAWTSEDTSVATVENGTVVAVGAGTTTVYAEYANVKLSCIVRCAKSVGKAAAANTGNYIISHTDATIKVDETFALTLKDKNGNVISVTWTVADGTVCSVSGNTVTGLAAGMTEVSVTYEGVTYTCTVRVK